MVGAPGDDTSIGGVAADSGQHRVVYDLSGRPVKNPKAGIYIVDGRKIVVR